MIESESSPKREFGGLVFLWSEIYIANNNDDNNEAAYNMVVR